MIKWEYNIFREDPEHGIVTRIKQLDEMGADGWELVSRHLVPRPIGTTYEYIFKRPLAKPALKELERIARLGERGKLERRG